MADGANPEARARVGQLLGFIGALHDLRNPIQRSLPHKNFPVPLWWSELPQSSHVQARQPGDANPADDVLIVSRPDLEPAPPPPPHLLSWLRRGWDQPTQREAQWDRERSDPDGESTYLSEDHELALLEWQDERSAWVERALPEFRALELFNTLWGMYSQFQREGEAIDLVLGDGHVAWQRAGVSIAHPVLLQPVELEFDASIPQFRVVLTERPVEFADALFRPDTKATANTPPPFDSSLVGALRNQALAAGLGPLDGGRADTFLKGLATYLDPGGQIVANDPRPKAGHDLRAFRDPALFLRARTAGYAKAIADALESIETRRLDELPESLLALAGVFPEKVDHGELPDEPWILPDELPDVLLTKPANREQLQVLRRLAKHHNVLVQGPPGTGKTHTIANILGHLLSEGKTVLVTAQTTKALRVLRDQVPAPLRPLCVSVLDRDSSSIVELNESASAISERLGQAPPSLAETMQLARTREAILTRLVDLRAELLLIVGSEHASLRVGNWSGGPTEAAKWLDQRAGADGWLPGPISGPAAPLTQTEVANLYRINGVLSADELREIAAGLPDPAAIWSPAEFGELLRSCATERELAQVGDQYWHGGARGPNEIEEFRRQAEAVFNWFAKRDDWELAAAHDGAQDPANRNGWIALAVTLDAFAVAESARTAAAKLHGPQVGPHWAGRDDELLDYVRAMTEHVRAGGTFGAMTLLKHPAWRRVLATCQTLERAPATVAELVAIGTVPGAALALAATKTRWRLVFGKFKVLPPSDGVDARERANQIRDALEAVGTRFTPLRGQARDLGLDLDELITVPSPPRRSEEWRAYAAEALSKLPRILDGELARITLAAADEARRAMLTTLAKYQRSGSAQAVAAAIPDEDPDAYGSAHARLVSLASRRLDAEQRMSLLARLEVTARAWAIAIGDRIDPHGTDTPPGDFDAAWTWCLLAQELENTTARDTTSILAKIHRERAALSPLTLQLAEARAWRTLHQRTSQRALHALGAYAVAVKGMGKGKGKLATLLQSVTREAMQQARSSVPVWIAPLYRVAETFDAKRSQFDVVIIDEASQLDVTGLLAWFFGKQVIVVGDQEQVSPDAVGIEQAQVVALMQQHLQSIRFPELYHQRSSVYDLARTVFLGSVKLREHFRCVPDIIGFSNELSYNWEILPLRNEASANVHPAVVFEFVEDGARGENRKENLREAEQVASLLIAAHEQPEYDRLTFGVISLLGSGEQSARIEQFIRRELSAEAIERGRMSFGTPAQFQGDERDVIFLTIVDGPSDDGRPLALRSAESDSGGLKKRYNVAVSRAKDQVWVVTSLRSDDLKPDDLRKRLLDFAADPSGQRQRNAQLNRKTQSHFEKEVANRLTASGYDVTAQHPAGAYFIDLLVRDGSTHLAIECDGKQHFLNQDAIREDLDRQALLERLGYTFHRIRSSHFYRHKDATMERVFERLSEMGIKPTFPSSGSGEPAVPASEVVDRIRHRAAEIREIWRQGGSIRATANRTAAPGKKPQSQPYATSTAPIITSPTDAAPPASVLQPNVVSPVALPPTPVGPVPAPPSGVKAGSFVQYQEASLGGLRKVMDLGEEIDVVLHPMILEVARVEGPVHFELVMKRLRHHYGMQRAGARTQKHVLRSIDRLSGTGRVVLDRIDAGTDLFVRSPGAAAIPRAPGLSGLRNSSHIAPSEFQAGVMALSSTRGSARTGLVEGVSREFGFARTSAQLSQALDAAIEALIGQGQLLEQRGLVRSIR